MDNNRCIMDQREFKKMVEALGSITPEQGGVLGGVRSDGTILHFYHDLHAKRSHVTYTMSTDLVNQVLDDWESQSIQVVGIIHTHPVGCGESTPADDLLFEKNLRGLKNASYLYCPIMEFQGEDDENRYKWVLHWNICWIDSRGIFRKEPSFLHIVDANKNVINTGKDFSLLVKSKQTNIKEEIFKRVSDCYDIPLLSQSRLVVIGVGGAGEYVEQMARSGVGQFVLIDPDVVELSNIATQQAYLHDVGRKKVSVVKQRLLQINPHVQVLTCPAYLDDYSDEQMQNLIFSSHEGVDKPSQTLICGFTDSFDAQKRINRLALQFAIPYISAQVYQQGVGCEVCFTHPDVTPACQRCALASRYAAYDKGDVKSVGSQGSPLHTTQRLNALKGFITMMLLHVHSDFPRYKGQLQKLWNRNMAIVRCDPAYKDTLKLDLFERTFGTINPYIYSDETVWVSIRPDDGTDGNPVCPDCGGTGNLYDSEGIFLDTIKGMRKRAEKEGEVCINSL